jgi:hypothetical protein
MTVSTSSGKTSSSLREAAAALQDAETALGREDSGATHEALIALARASYASLSGFERESLPALAPTHALQERLATWRQQLDETRVQLALAEMEARDAAGAIAKRVEELFEPTTDRVSSAVRDIVDTLADVRRGLADRSS